MYAGCTSAEKGNPRMGEWGREGKSVSISHSTVGFRVCEFTGAMRSRLYNVALTKLYYPSLGAWKISDKGVKQNSCPWIRSPWFTDVCEHPLWYMAVFLCLDHLSSLCIGLCACITCVGAFRGHKKVSDVSDRNWIWVFWESNKCLTADQSSPWLPFLKAHYLVG